MAASRKRDLASEINALRQRIERLEQGRKPESGKIAKEPSMPVYGSPLSSAFPPLPMPRWGSWIDGYWHFSRPR